MHRVGRAVAVVTLVVLVTTGAAASSTAAASGPAPVATSAEPGDPMRVGGGAIGTASDGDIHLTAGLALTPDRPGTIDVTLRYRLPDRVTDLTTIVPSRATVTATDGFRAAGGDRFEWNGGSDAPTLTYRLPVNETATATGPEGDDGRFRFVDPGPWALVRLPPTRTEGEYLAGDGAVGVDRKFVVDGQGAVGGSTAFLGPATVHRASAAGQRFRLVVPEASTPAESPGEILDAVGEAAEAFEVGPRDDAVFMVAAPASADWGVRGLQAGERDLWVQADQPLEGPDNVWYHEYVHTRTAYDATSGTRWVVEGATTYYAALLALDTGRASFDETRRFLARGADGERAQSVLSEPETWQSNANYLKGALVAGELDRRIRLSTGGERSLGTVADRWLARDDALTADGFVSLVGTVGGDGPRAAARRYATTGAAPTVWNRSQHEAAFPPLPPYVTYDFPTGASSAGALWVDGPYRNGTLTASDRDRANDGDGSRVDDDGGDAGRVVLAPGETLTVGTVVRNQGGQPGGYDATLERDGEPLRRWSGDLPAETSETLLANLTVEAPGTTTLTLGDQRLVVDVREPARATVAEVAVEPRTVDVGEPIRVAAVVENDAAIPGRANVSFTVDGETVERRTASVGPRERRLVETTVTPAEPGTVTVGVAGADAAAVTVEDDGDGRGTGTTTGGTGDGAGGGGSPDEATDGSAAGGFTVGAAVAALVAVLIGRWVRRRGR